MSDNKTCQCGEHKKCVRNINADNSGRLWVNDKEHFSCGKVKNQIKQINRYENRSKNMAGQVKDSVVC